ncbi:MAG TPA: ribosome biogenesis GTPase Der [Chitinophagales bacterium]|nr:ribosome biogenesis GTPase Der [Chitinophagales bacterium]
MGFTVAIVGRPNVGKSTLFNRLIGERQAIVDDRSGVTRDRQYGMVHWAGKDFNLIDTGGFVAHSDDVFEKEIREQVQIAIEESSLILFLVDVKTGITELELDIAKMLRKSKKEVLVVVNKVDNLERQYDANEFYSLGFTEYYNVSSISGSGTGELLDAITERIPEKEEEVKDPRIPRIAIIGQPNVGKSSLLNALAGEPRNIVTEIAGTTRDSIHTRYNLFNKDLLLIDTAGIRKQDKVKESIEFYAVIRALKAIDESDVCVLMIDATEGIEAQDLKIFSTAAKKRKGIVIAVNKWDLIEEKHSKTAEEFENEIKSRIAPFTDVPVIFISAKTKQRIFRIIETALEVYKRMHQKIPTSELNEAVKEAVQHYPPPAIRGKLVKIKYATQVGARGQTFAFFCSHPKYIKEPYRNYLENTLRQKFDFKGVPLTLMFKEK